MFSKSSSRVRTNIFFSVQLWSPPRTNHTPLPVTCKYGCLKGTVKTRNPGWMLSLPQSALWCPKSEARRRRFEHQWDWSLFVQLVAYRKFHREQVIGIEVKLFLEVAIPHRTGFESFLHSKFQLLAMHSRWWLLSLGSCHLQGWTSWSSQLLATQPLLWVFAEWTQGWRLSVSVCLPFN